MASVVERLSAVLRSVAARHRERGNVAPIFRHQRANVYGAFDDDKLLGIVHFVFHRSTWMTENTCYLQDLYVAESARGRGVGQALIAAVYAEADRRSGGQVYWLTHHSNHPARQLYDRLAKSSGFILYERHTEVAE